MNQQLRRTVLTLSGLSAAVVACGGIYLASTQSAASNRTIAIKITGGFETDRRDGGRPVVLIAAALGVPTDVFRRAFSGVTPARDREPDPEQVRRNKDALLSVLAQYGITNGRLDTVSDFYRYNRRRGEMWRNTPASGYAFVSHGKVVGFKITNAGSGYSSIPTVSVPGFDDFSATVTVNYTKRFETNGSISLITLATAKKVKD